MVKLVMIRKRTVAGLAGLLVLGACATDSPSGPRTSALGPSTAAFRSADFDWSVAAGSGAINGQVAYGARRAHYDCAGVVLTPETPWVRQRMAILYRSTERAALPAEEVRGRTPPERSQDYSKYVKRASCGADGRFSFSGLPDGSWYVIAVAKADGAAAPEMALMRRVSVRGGKTVDVRL
jgi:hypothetical protein